MASGLAARASGARGRARRRGGRRPARRARPATARADHQGRAALTTATAASGGEGAGGERAGAPRPVGRAPERGRPARRPRRRSAGTVSAGIAHDQSTAAWRAKAARIASGSADLGPRGAAPAARTTPHATDPISTASSARPTMPSPERKRSDHVVGLARVERVVAGAALLAGARGRSRPRPGPAPGRRAKPRQASPHQALRWLPRRVHQPAGVVGDGVAALAAELGHPVARPAAGVAAWRPRCPPPRRRTASRHQQHGARARPVEARSAPAAQARPGASAAASATPTARRHPRPARPPRAGPSGPGRRSAAGRCSAYAAGQARPDRAGGEGHERRGAPGQERHASRRRPSPATGGRRASR